MKHTYLMVIFLLFSLASSYGSHNWSQIGDEGLWATVTGAEFLQNEAQAMDTDSKPYRSKRKHEEDHRYSEHTSKAIAYPSIKTEVKELTSDLTIAWNYSQHDPYPLFLPSNQDASKFLLNPYYEASIRKLEKITTLVPSQDPSLQEARTLLKSILRIDPTAGAQENVMPFS